MPFLNVAYNSDVSTPAPLQQLMDEHYKKGSNPFKNAFLNLKYKAIVQAAETLGAQRGFEWESKKLWDTLQSQKENLDKVYDFQRWMLDGGRVIPPVIEKADNNFQMQGPDTAVTSQMVYKILKPAALTSAAPNWRDYFVPPEKLPDMKANYALMPKNAAEEAAWREGVQEGWKYGVRQAVEQYKVSLNRLQRDYLGMVMFWKLAQQHMVSAPILSNGDVGIKVGDNTLSINQKVFRLTLPAYFNKTGNWDVTPYAPKIPHNYVAPPAVGSHYIGAPIQPSLTSNSHNYVGAPIHAASVSSKKADSSQ